MSFYKIIYNNACKIIALSVLLFSTTAYAETISYKTPKTQCNLKILNDGKEQEDTVGCYRRRNSDTEEFIKETLGDSKFKALLDWKNKNFSNDPFDDSFYVMNDNIVIVSIITAPIAGGLFTVNLSQPEASSTRISYGGCYIDKILKDKSNIEHFVLKCGVLSHGVESEYAEILNSNNLQSIDKQRSGITRLFDGSQDGESGGCERHEFLGLKEANINQTISYKDINKDSYPDIIVTFVRQNCETNKKRSYTKKYYAAKHGFYLNR